MKPILDSYYFISDKVSQSWGWLDKKFGVPNKPHALPMRIFDDDEKSFTWEDWHKEAKENYPIRHFLFEELDISVSVFFKRRVEDPLYWLNSRFFKKHHIIDLRGGKVSTWEREYNGGYIDPCNALEIAMHKAFKRYVKELESRERGIDSRIQYLENLIEEIKGTDREELELKWIEDELKEMAIIKEIDNFFEVELEELLKKEDELWEKVSEAPNTREAKRPIHKEITALELKRVQRTTEVLTKLINIRGRFWT